MLSRQAASPAHHNCDAGGSDVGFANPKSKPVLCRVSEMDGTLKNIGFNDVNAQIREHPMEKPVTIGIHGHRQRLLEVSLPSFP